MKKFSFQLPSLDALVYFEAAARHGSFTKAARELFVTQAAVSKRIKETEERLGTPLFTRNGRTVTLTQAGRRLQERVTMALEYLEDACLEISSDYEEPIRISANSAVSLLWLSPRLREFGLSESTSSINLVTTDRVSEQLQGSDLAIIYGFNAVPGWKGDLLFMENLAPVASPAYFERLGAAFPRDLEAIAGLAVDAAFLEYERLAPDWVNWRVWFEQMKVALPNRALVPCKSYAQTIGEAIKGNGIALGSLSIIRSELESGQLRLIGDEVLERGRGYYLVYPANRKPGASAGPLRDWLLDSL